MDYQLVYNIYVYNIANAFGLRICLESITVKKSGTDGV